MKLTECRGCGAKIGFIETKTGKWLPINPEPVDANSCNPGDRLVGEDGIVFTVQSESNEYGYVPHWATCPDAAKFVRK